MEVVTIAAGLSRLKKGSHNDKKFLKKVSEKIHTWMSQVWNHKLDDQWMTIWESSTNLELLISLLSNRLYFHCTLKF